MTVRRVVTSQDSEGRSVVVEDATVEPATMPEYPGCEPHEMWGSDDTATVPSVGAPAPTTTYFPPVNGVRFQVIVFPPGDATGGGDPDDDPGMHITDTVDYIYIASGELVLALDDGTEVPLSTGDTVVQQGARHAWHNRGDQPCVVVGTLVGAWRTRD